MRKKVLLFVAMTVATAGPALAQTANRSWWGHAGFTYNEPLGLAADYLEASGGFAGGVTFRPSDSQLGVMAELAWSDFNGPRWEVETGVPGELATLEGHAEVGSLTVNGVWRAPTEGRLGFYAVAGVGAYRRYVDIATEEEYETVIFCDPWWGGCWEESAPVEEVLGSRSSIEFGFNAGVGVSWRLAIGAELYLEARYTWVDGTRETEYVPIALGVRF